MVVCWTVKQWGYTTDAPFQTQTVKLIIPMTSPNFSVFLTLGNVTQGESRYIILQCVKRSTTSFALENAYGGQGTVFWFVVGE